MRDRAVPIRGTLAMFPEKDETLMAYQVRLQNEQNEYEQAGHVRSRSQPDSASVAAVNCFGTGL